MDQASYMRMAKLMMSSQQKEEAVMRNQCTVKAPTDQRDSSLQMVITLELLRGHK